MLKVPGIFLTPIYTMLKVNSVDEPNESHGIKICNLLPRICKNLMSALVNNKKNKHVSV